MWIVGMGPIRPHGSNYSLRLPVTHIKLPERNSQAIGPRTEHMENGKSKPISIISTKVANRRTLVEMVRSWAEALPPNAPLEVQYTYDPRSQTRGFHLLFSETALAATSTQAESPAKEVRQEDKPCLAA